MKISFNWLKEFIDLDLSPEETAEKLTLIGLEVESVDAFGSKLDGVIVGEILKVKNHPNADKLLLCEVDLGNQKVQIACGANNVAEGQKVPVATVGTTLPVKLDNGEELTIRKAKLRGEVSEGMICAEDELGLGRDHSGIMVLDEKHRPGTPLHQVFELYTDTVIDIAITPNRPDATCHLGVARDLAAVLGKPLKKPFKTSLPDQPPIDDFAGISIETPDKCHRYVGKVVENVKIEESPAWLRNKLKAVGIRPVNNVVDATNYVMLELGQPLHAFDNETLRGDRIVVKDYDSEISFETLDHVKRDCPPGTLFICDGEGPVAIAGVMGGVDSEVSDNTSTILIESAYFDPGTIRKTAKQQGLQTDASYRFERGIDPTIQRIAAERAAELIAELTGGSIPGRCTDVHPVKHKPNELELRRSYTNRLLGTDFTMEQINHLLKGLELSAREKGTDAITYTVPPFRPDLEREVDLIEEVGRLYDYNNIAPPEHTRFSHPEPVNFHEQLLEKTRSISSGLGFREIYSNSLISEEDAKLQGDLDQMLHTLNPISKDMTTLRPGLVHGFLKTVSYNLNRNISGMKLFEIGHVFNKSDEGVYFEGINEEIHLLLGVAGYRSVEHWNEEPAPFDFFDLKGAVYGLFQQLPGLQEEQLREKSESGMLSFSLAGKPIGTIKPIAPAMLEAYDIEQPALAAEFSLSAIEKYLEETSKYEYKPVSKFPSFEFDFAVTVDKNVAAGDMMDTIRQQTDDRLRDLQIFDVFEGKSLGKNKKSVAFRLSFIDHNKTLTIKDIEPIIDKVLNKLENKFSAKLRS